MYKQLVFDIEDYIQKEQKYLLYNLKNESCDIVRDCVSDFKSCIRYKFFMTEKHCKTIVDNMKEKLELWYDSLELSSLNNFGDKKNDAKFAEGIRLKHLLSYVDDQLLKMEEQND